MSISRSSAPPRPRAGARSRGCAPVVPKPGMVTARMPAAGRPRRSKVRTQTRRARVESRPPERPRTTRFTPTCSRRRARPAVWIEKTSRQRSSSVAGSAGTNGCGSIARTRRWGCGAGTGREGDRPVGRGVVVDRVGERGLPRALDAQPLHVHVGHDHLAVPAEALALGEQDAVLGDQQVAAEDEVGRGLVDAGVGVDVGGERAARLLAHQLAAVLGLGHEVVRGRGVQEDGGARDRVARARAGSAPRGPRRSRPRGSPRGPPAAGTGGPCRRERPGRRGAPRPRAPRAPRRTSAPRSTPCSRGGRSSGTTPEDPARLQHRRGVEESAALQHRQPDDHDHGATGRLAQDPLERALGAADQGGQAEEEVPAGVAGEPQLGQDDEPGRRRRPPGPRSRAWRRRSSRDRPPAPAGRPPPPGESRKAR